MELHTDVRVVGGGSGGIGAALAAARAGTQVILVEKQAKLGGTSTLANVNSWEPGPGCAFVREIYHMKKHENERNMKKGQAHEKRTPIIRQRLCLFLFVRLRCG